MVSMAAPSSDFQSYCAYCKVSLLSSRVVEVEYPCQRLKTICSTVLSTARADCVSAAPVCIIPSPFRPGGEENEDVGERASFLLLTFVVVVPPFIVSCTLHYSVSHKR